MGSKGEPSNMTPNLEWDIYFLKIAHTVGQHSKCLSRQIGAVLVKDKSIISTGYNGPPAGIPHCDTRNENGEQECPRRLAGYESGEGLHLCIAGHAERNAVLNAAKMGICTNGTTLYCDCSVPCKDCLIELINAGITTIVYNTFTWYSSSVYYDDISDWIIENSDLRVYGIDPSARQIVNLK